MTTKFQMVLPMELAGQLRDLASRKGLPLAQLIRETMEARIREEALRRPRIGVLERLRGIADTIEDTDLSTRADYYLYGDPNA